MRYLLAVTLLATMAAAQQQPKASCFGSSSDSAKSASSQSSPSNCAGPQIIADFHQQIQLRDQATFALSPAVARTTVGSNRVGSNYVPPPQLTPLHQTSDDFSSTAGFQLGTVMARQIEEHKATSFAKKFCRSYGSGAAWWYQFSNGERIEGVCK